MAINIRPLEAEDYDAWYPLWLGYLTFYEAQIADDVTRISFDRIVADDGEIEGFCAIDDNGDMLGFVTYLFHLSTWSTGPKCYLGDLFTNEAARGKGVGRRLIAAVNDAAKSKGADHVYWLTQEHNYAGRMLYDKVAQKTPFIKYMQKI